MHPSSAIVFFFNSMTEPVDMQIWALLTKMQCRVSDTRPVTLKVPVCLENHFVYQILKHNIFPCSVFECTMSG